MLDLGCIGICDNIVTASTATKNGGYYLEGVFNGRLIKKTQQFNITDPLIFDTFGLPENYVLELDLRDPDGLIVLANIKVKIQDVRIV